MNKFFRLSEIKYLLVLLLSMAIFILAFCIERYYDATPIAEVALYSLGFLIALAWGILNYVSHLKLSTIYKKHNDINAFVESMAMSKDDKAELSQYLSDFARDLEEKGESHESALKKAISHFQVQEFLELSGSDMFEKPTHWYMIGYILLFLGLALVTSILYFLLKIPVFVLTAFTLILYSIGFLVLFFLYKSIDGFISKS